MTKIRKRIKPTHIKFLKKYELCKILYDNEETKIWRIGSVVCMRTHVTDKVKLISKTMNHVRMGNPKYSNTPDCRLPIKEKERRKKELKRRNKYNHWMDINDIQFQLSDCPIYSNRAKTRYHINQKRLARYMICENC
jgi:hypothetical protein